LIQPQDDEENNIDGKEGGQVEIKTGDEDREAFREPIS
jgi:hypothetical protein